MKFEVKRDIHLPDILCYRLITVISSKGQWILIIWLSQQLEFWDILFILIQTMIMCLTM